MPVLIRNWLPLCIVSGTVKLEPVLVVPALFLITPVLVLTTAVVPATPLR